MQTEYNEMTNDELMRNIDLCRTRNGRIIPSRIYKNSELFNEILKRTSFLQNVKFLSERIYCIKNNIKEIVLCQECHKNPVRFNPCMRNPRYVKFCCSSCANKNIETQNNKKHSCLEMLGVDNPSKSQEIQHKKEITCLKNYNVRYPSQCPDILKKQQDTYFKMTGYRFASQNPVVKQKIKETNDSKVHMKNGRKG